MLFIELTDRFFVWYNIYIEVKERKFGMAIEVFDRMDADLAVVFSEEYNYKVTIETLYFKDTGESAAEVFAYIAENYKYLLVPSTRIDIYKVRNGYKVGRA